MSIKVANLFGNVQSATGDDPTDQVKTLINPFVVFSGSVPAHQFIEAQKSLIESMGPEAYSQIMLEVLHAEITTLIEEVKMDCEPGIKPNTSLVGQA